MKEPHSDVWPEINPSHFEKLTQIDICNISSHLIFNLDGTGFGVSKPNRTESQKVIVPNAFLKAPIFKGKADFPFVAALCAISAAREVRAPGFITKLETEHPEIQCAIMLHEMAAEPAPLEILLPRLTAFCIPRILCNILQQTRFVNKSNSDASRIPYSRYRRIAAHYSIVDQCAGEGIRIECPRNRVKSELEHRLDRPEHQGKHTALEQDREQPILDWIKRNAEGITPVTRKEIKDYCTSQFQVPITCGSVNSFLLRYPDEIIQAKSSARKEQRLQVPRMFLERTLQNFNEYVEGCTAELVFNLDEVGVSDCEDRKGRKVVIPATMGSQTKLDISRNILKGETYLSDCLCTSLLENRSPLTLLHRKILPRSEGRSKSMVFASERI
jgi:hypothetical protein